MELNGTTYRIGQANNALLFPGLGLGATVTGASNLSEAMFLAAARAIAGLADPTDQAKGLLPMVSQLREVSATVAVAVADAAIAAGLNRIEVANTIEAVREAKTTLGSGVVMVFDDTVNMHGILQRIAQFFRNESCGQCVPCRVGTVRQQEALARLASGKPRGGVETELELIAEIGGCMRDASICGLGQAASSAVESAIDRLGVFKEGAR